MSGDERTTIGLTPESKGTMEKLMPYFNEQAHAAKFAMALAIQNGIEPGKTTNIETVWNVGSFDPDRELYNLVVALYPSSTSPYTAAEHFVNQGLQLLEQHIEENKNIDIAELV